MERAGLGSLRSVSDAGAAQWAVDGIRPFAEHVATSLVPAVFAAYARLSHPAWQGSLPAERAHHLVGVLSRFTSSSDCYFAVWNGFAGLAVPPTATLAMPERAMALLRGPLAEAATASMTRAPGDQSPSLWWPVDRAWCVATDVDLTTTYVGGGRACVDAIVAEPALEASPIDARQGITRDSAS